MELRICEIVARVLGVDKTTVSVDSKREDLEAWDSMQHLNLMMVVQQECCCEIGFDQIISIRSVADIVQAVEEA